MIKEQQSKNNYIVGTITFQLYVSVISNWPSSGWIQCQRNYIPTINIVISVSVNTEKGKGDEISFTKSRACVQTGGGNFCISSNQQT